jgi:DNA helicase-2/ATP-dependent DNA helicase PcrA
MQIRDIENELVRFRIPYVVRGGRGLLQTEEVRDVISYLKLAANVKDFMALNRAISIPKRGMGSVALEKIRKVADTEFSGDLIKACEKVNIDKLSSFIEIIQQVQSNIASPVAALERVVKLTNYENYIKEKYKKEPDRVRDKLENLERLALIIGSLVEDAKLNLEDIVFQLSMDSSQEDESVGKVTISTIHSAKGLEWGRVFVTNLHEGSLPHKFSMGSPDEIDEERRLFYVAVTRAKDTCVLCIPTIVMQGPNSHTVAPSRFLTEIKVINI